MAILASFSNCAPVEGLAPSGRDLFRVPTQEQSHRGFPRMRRNVSDSTRESVREGMAFIVKRTVAAQRRIGMKGDEAMAVAARRLGISARRVKAYLYGEVHTVPAHEAAGIVAGWRRSSEARIEALQAEIAAEQSNLEQMERQCADVSTLLRAASEAAR